MDNETYDEDDARREAEEAAREEVQEWIAENTDHGGWSSTSTPVFKVPPGFPIGQLRRLVAIERTAARTVGDQERNGYREWGGTFRALQADLDLAADYPTMPATTRAMNQALAEGGKYDLVVPALIDAAAEQLAFSDGDDTDFVTAQLPAIIVDRYLANVSFAYTKAPQLVRTAMRDRMANSPAANPDHPHHEGWKQFHEALDDEVDLVPTLDSNAEAPTVEQRTSAVVNVLDRLERELDVIENVAPVAIEEIVDRIPQPVRAVLVELHEERLGIESGTDQGTSPRRLVVNTQSGPGLSKPFKVRELTESERQFGKETVAVAALVESELGVTSPEAHAVRRQVDEVLDRKGMDMGDVNPALGGEFVYPRAVENPTPAQLEAGDVYKQSDLMVTVADAYGVDAASPLGRTELFQNSATMAGLMANVPDQELTDYSLTTIESSTALPVGDGAEAPLSPVARDFYAGHAEGAGSGTDGAEAAADQRSAYSQYAHMLENLPVVDGVVYTPVAELMTPEELAQLDGLLRGAGTSEEIDGLIAEVRERLGGDGRSAEGPTKTFDQVVRDLAGDVRQQFANPGDPADRNTSQTARDFYAGLAEGAGVGTEGSGPEGPTETFVFHASTVKASGATNLPASTEEELKAAIADFLGTSDEDTLRKIIRGDDGPGVDDEGDGGLAGPSAPRTPTPDQGPTNDAVDVDPGEPQPERRMLEELPLGEAPGRQGEQVDDLADHPSDLATPWLPTDGAPAQQLTDAQVAHLEATPSDLDDGLTAHAGQRDRPDEMPVSNLGDVRDVVEAALGERVEELADAGLTDLGSTQLEGAAVGNEELPPEADLADIKEELVGRGGVNRGPLNIKGIHL